MKIIINAYSARIGGGQTYLINLLQNLPDNPALQIGIFAPDSLALPSDNRIKRLHTVWPTTNPLLRVVWERAILPFTLLRLKADVLFCPGGLINTRPLHACNTVTMFRNMLPFDPSWRSQLPIGFQKVRNWLLERAMLRSMKHADLTIFISDYARSVIEKLTRVKNGITVPHGISNRFRAPETASTEILDTKHEKYIVYVSRFDFYKHHFEVVSAYAKLSSAIKNNYKLFLVGENDMPEGDRVRNALRQLGLVDRVVLTGPIDYNMLPTIYTNSALIIFASSCENCPNILLESMASGRPVLSSSVQPMPEFGGDSVLYFNPREPDELAHQMTKVLTDTALHDHLCHSAAKKSADYSWERTSSITWNAIQGLPTKARSD